MNTTAFLLVLCTLAPAAFMLNVALRAWLAPEAVGPLWRHYRLLSGLALVPALVSLALQWSGAAPALPGSPWLAAGPLSAIVAMLVQVLGTVIGAFSARYLEGEPAQARYIAALAGVLGAVHLLLLANHWLVLIAAWVAVGLLMQTLLCFYPQRPFAQLAAHKKRLADLLAWALLAVAAGLAWAEVGSGSFAALAQHLAQHEASAALHWSAVCLVLAVILSTALLPVHGWLIQVMEAPTPVSALMHAGVVNLGGFVLIRFAPLLEAAPAARWLLVVFGLGTALLAGLVMLTRISIKVRLAWSTVAQMGFMVLECGLGLYMLAALHLIGHSLYKAHAFLASSGVVAQTRLLDMHGRHTVAPASLWLAPLLAAVVVGGATLLLPGASWPWWWSAVLALAWAPLLWLPTASDPVQAQLRWSRLGAGLAMVLGLATLAAVVHLLPLGLRDQPHETAGLVAAAGMAVMYLALLTLQWRAPVLESWRRWSYAGFYVDEFYTRVALRVWPTAWAPAASTTPNPAAR
ncbi:MAG: NADH-quinone oxidoreductase subunit L [Curvibacter sp.]|nr:NADH-quinone oxidoreductase subunit L [Curvibacter sp.]